MTKPYKGVMPATLPHFDCRLMDRLHPDTAKGSRWPSFLCDGFCPRALACKKRFGDFAHGDPPSGPTRTRVSLYKRAPPGRQAGLYTLSLAFCRKDRALKIPRVRKAEWMRFQSTGLPPNRLKGLPVGRAADAGCFADAGLPKMKNRRCIFVPFRNKRYACVWMLHAGAIWRKGHILAR